jgi:hypothetical protein
MQTDSSARLCYIVGISLGNHQVCLRGDAVEFGGLIALWEVYRKSLE